MSYELIRSALEVKLNALQPSVATAWENITFQPSSDMYQKAYLLPANTSNPTYGDGLRRESGILQVSVYAPIGNGSLDAVARAELIRDWFPRGLSLTNGSITVRIDKTPSLAPAMSDGQWYVIPVSIPYSCDVF